MRRREFIAVLGGAAAAWPLLARAQQGDRLRQIGVLMSVLQDDPAGVSDVTALKQGLAEFGWTEGRSIGIHFRWAGGDVERARALAKELVALKPDVLVARSTPTALALKAETEMIPIVFANVSEPVESGLVHALARPGGNATGFTNYESSIGGKWLQLLKEVDPRIDRVGIIYNPQTAPYAKIITALGIIGGADAVGSNRRSTGPHRVRYRDGRSEIGARAGGRSRRHP
jgi:putative ABC transport system substrate-binding protein